MDKIFNALGNRTGLSLKLKEQDGLELDIDQKILTEMMSFKAKLDKNSKGRLQNIYGPYEVGVIEKTGKLPPDWYEPDDPEPWGLRVEESQSNLIWQSASGMLDPHPPFAMVYLDLGLEVGMDEDYYVKQLQNLNKDWARYARKNGLFADHRHDAMGHIYNQVACPCCSGLAALEQKEPGKLKFMKDMLGFSPQDRQQALLQAGILALFKQEIPKNNSKLEFLKG